jgi:hypothetical protein
VPPFRGDHAERSATTTNFAAVARRSAYADDVARDRWTFYRVTRSELRGDVADHGRVATEDYEAEKPGLLSCRRVTFLQVRAGCSVPRNLVACHGVSPTL